MNKLSIIELLSIGEKREVEFKKSKNSLPKSLWESYSALSNTKGRCNCSRNR